MDVQLIAGLLLSGLIGLSLGLIGGGGSIITVPVLVYVIGVEAREAVGMSLAVVGGTSLVGASMHYRRGTVELRTGLLFGAAGVVGAFAGAPLTSFMTPRALMLAFAGLMLVVALMMLKRARAADVAEEPAPASPAKALAAGFGVGVMTGFLGVGGGFLIVPALVMFGGLPMRKAVGTSLFVIFLNCLAGFAGHASRMQTNWTLTAEITAVAVAGAAAGTMLSGIIAPQRLQKAFAGFVLMVAAALFVLNMRG